MQFRKHPKLQKLVLVLTDSTEIVTRSAYSKGDRLVLDIDYKIHPAWGDGTGQLINLKSDRVKKFNDKFNSVDFSQLPSKNQQKKNNE